ncbi:hypothetical protein M8I35_22265 [Micromonospora sp. MSM11]|nr:hypothetical protein [Micromonospora sp. MSM11]MCL7459904.1 hypothetical protein [Micromonospora sp. MSM11]
MSASDEPTGSTGTEPPDNNRRRKVRQAAMLIIQVTAWLATIASAAVVVSSRLT